jgi:hypothetical protein
MDKLTLDKDAIARRYAQNLNRDIILHCVDKDIYRYYRIDYTNRARYTGHPHIIKIDDNGTITQVRDLDEIYWAVKQGRKVVQLL